MTLRVAVAIPSLSPAAVERRQIEAAVTALAELAEIEVFVESTRLQEGDLPGPAFHYLRLPERQASEPFDAALYPVGRDFRPYEPGVLLSRRLPSVVWLLDTMTHHVLVGGLAQSGRWDRYVEIMGESGTAGMAAAATIVAGWGMRAVFRSNDPMPGMCARENRIIVASPDITAGVPAGAAVVPLPSSSEVLRPPDRQFDGARRVAFVSPNLAWPHGELRAIREVLRQAPEVVVRYHLIKVFEPAIRAAASGLGIDSGVEWVVEDGVAARAELADWADVIVATTGDPTLNDRSIVVRGIAAGQIALVTRTPAWETLPAGSAIILEPGREREVGLRTMLLELATDEAFARGVAVAGRGNASGCPASTTAELLHAQLAIAGAARPTFRRMAPGALASCRTRMLNACQPHNRATVRHLIEQRIAAVLPDPAGPPQWRAR